MLRKKKYIVANSSIDLNVTVMCQHIKNNNKQKYRNQANYIMLVDMYRYPAEFHIPCSILIK